MLDRLERQGDAADLERQAGPDLLDQRARKGVGVGVDLIADLEGGDLGQVEHVVDPGHACRHLDLRVAVDREVAERVRCGRRRRAQQNGRRHEECDGSRRHPRHHGHDAVGGTGTSSASARALTASAWRAENAGPERNA